MKTLLYANTTTTNAVFEGSFFKNLVNLEFKNSNINIAVFLLSQIIQYKMKSFVKIILPTLFLTLFSCKQNAENQQKKTEIPITINLDNEKSNNLNSYFNLINNFEFLSLNGLSQEDQIGIVKKVFCLDNQILIFDYKKSNILVFDNFGNYIKKIGERGAGPEQYKRINDIEINVGKNRIYLLDNPYLLTYNLNGDFLNKKLLEFYPVRIAILPDNNLSFNLPTLDDDYSHLIIADENGDFLTKQRAYPDYTEFIGNSRTGGVTSNGDKVYYGFTGTSDIYELDSNYNLNLKYKFLLGTDMWPSEAKDEVMKFRVKFKENDVTFLYNTFWITDDWVLFEYKDSKLEDTSFGTYNVNSSNIYTEDSFENENIIRIFNIPKGIDSKNRFVGTLDFEDYLEYFSDKTSQHLIGEFDNEFLSALNNMSLENTTILFFYNLKE